MPNMHSGRLPEEEVRELWRRSKQGDLFARNKLCIEHIPYVCALAKQRCDRYGCPDKYDDLVQVGCTALPKLVEEYDPERGVKFPTYAQKRLTGAMIDFYVEERLKGMHVVSTTRQHYSKVMRAYDDLLGEGMTPPTAKEIAELLRIQGHKVTAETVKEALELLDLYVGLDELVASDSGKAGREPAAEESTPEEAIEESEFRRIVADAIRELPDRYRKALILFYYKEMSVKEIAEVLNMNENTVKSDLSRARDKLRHNSKLVILAVEHDLWR